MPTKPANLPHMNENTASKGAAVIFAISLLVCILAGVAMVSLQIAALALGSSELSITAGSVLSKAAALGGSTACFAALLYYWCHRRTFTT